MFLIFNKSLKLQMFPFIYKIFLKDPIFLIDPLESLSKIITLFFIANFSTKALPKKPVPPVTSIFFS